MSPAIPRMGAGRSVRDSSRFCQRGRIEKFRSFDYTTRSSATHDKTQLNVRATKLYLTLQGWGILLRPVVYNHGPLWEVRDVYVPSWQLDWPKIVAYETWDHERNYRGLVRKGEITPAESLEIFEERLREKWAELSEAEE